MTKYRLRALLGATLLCVTYAAPVSASPETCTPTAETKAKPKKKKKGLGLGGLLKAARNAGVGEMLGAGNILGDSKVAQVAGAVAGTAVSASEGGSPNLMGSLGGLAGSSRVAQIAGAAAGTAAELARNAPPKEGAKTCKPAGEAAPTSSTWN